MLRGRYAARIATTIRGVHTQTADVVVVGGGVMGAAAAYAAAKSKARVVLVEQFGRAHPYGSSAGDGRIARLAYDCPVYVSLGHAAHAAWDALSEDAERLGRETRASTSAWGVQGGKGGSHAVPPPLAADAPVVGGPVRTVCGSLDFGKVGTDTLVDLIANYTQLGLEHEILDAASVADRFPQFSIGEDEIAVYQDAGSVMHASRAVATLYAAAEDAGAVVMETTGVEAIEMEAEGASHVVRAVNAGGEEIQLSTSKIILTGGGWTNSVLSGAGLSKLPLHITNEQTTYFVQQPGSQGVDHSPAAMPTFIGHRPDITPRGFYGIPHVPGGISGVKVAVMNEGETLSDAPDPNTRSFGVNNRMMDIARTFTELYFPHLNPYISTAIRCIYSNSPDFDFIIGPHREHADVVVGAGFSGHGFKFGIAVGQLLADHALSTSVLLDPQFETKFSPTRWS